MAGNALAKIRDARLYRDTHGTFEDYCREKWDISKPYATQFIQAAKVTENLVAIATIRPSNEAQVRPLTDKSLNADQQREAWTDAVERTTFLWRGQTRHSWRILRLHRFFERPEM